jgi:acyl-CoA thioester hydrolase
MRAPGFQSVPYPSDARYVRDAITGLVWHRVPYRILFADTDRTGVVYHGTYFRFFELGRASLLRDAGFPLRQVEGDGYAYPIFQLGLDFFRPIDYDVPIFVHTRFRELQRVRVDFDYLVTHGETGAVLCRGFTRHCATNRKGQPVAVDPLTVEIFHRFPT